MVTLAWHAAAARSPPGKNRGHTYVNRAAYLLCKFRRSHAALAMATAQHPDFQGAVAALLATAAAEDVTYANEVQISSAASAQVYLVQPCIAVWQRLLDSERSVGLAVADLPARQGSNVLWVRARLFADDLMAAPDEAEWRQLCAFLRHSEDAKAFAHGMSGQSMSNTLWTGAVGLGFPPDVLAALLAAIAQAAGTLMTQAVANTV
jgi:hypothetical protein